MGVEGKGGVWMRLLILLVFFFLLFDFFWIDIESDSPPAPREGAFLG